MSVKRRMMRLGLKIVDLCQEMEKRGRTPHYMDVAAVYHGQMPHDSNVTEQVGITLDELEQERGVTGGN